jgi:hypothetical protein
VPTSQLWRCDARHCRAKPGHAAGTATRMRLVVLQAAFAAKVRLPRAWSGAVGRLPAAPLWRLAVVGCHASGCFAHGVRCVGRRRSWDEAAVCAARAQGGAAAVRCGPRFGVRCEGGGAELSSVGWLGAALAHRLLLAAAERDWAQVQARTCRASPLLPFVSLPSAHSNQRRCAVLEHGSTSAYQIAGALRVRLDLVGHTAVGLGRSRRVREGRRGAGAAAVECSS